MPGRDRAIGYDVIGDVHGHADPLERLLAELGYEERDGAHHHPDRQAVFVGDLIDRGPEQVRVLEIARRMVDAGTALVVLGNHELNAVSWATPDGRGGWCRPHSAKNRAQHGGFLAQVGEGSPRHRDWIDWFRALPLWLDLDGLRVVHACWHPASMDVLGTDRLTDELVTAPKGTPLHDAAEVLLKGPEIEMGGHTYADKDGHCRDTARLRWWDPAATTIASACEIPGGVTACDGGPFGPLPDTPLGDAVVRVPASDVPVLYGHYWRTGTPRTEGSKAACLDWSVAKGGPLVAYRWSGEADLDDDHLVAVG